MYDDFKIASEQHNKGLYGNFGNPAHCYTACVRLLGRRGAAAPDRSDVRSDDLQLIVAARRDHVPDIPAQNNTAVRSGSWSRLRITVNQEPVTITRVRAGGGSKWHHVRTVRICVARTFNLISPGGNRANIMHFLHRRIVLAFSESRVPASDSFIAAE